MVTNETVALCNVLETHRTVCAGYANIYSALLEAAGIQSVNLKGSTTTAGVTYEEFDTGVENHEWVAFWYPNENRWVYTDCTWDSGQYYEKGMYFDAPNKKKFFDITPLALTLDHRIDRAEQRFYFEALSFFEEAEPSQSSSDFKEETLPSATTTFSQTEQQAKHQDFIKSILICSIVVAFSILILWVLIFVRRNKSSKSEATMTRDLQKKIIELKKEKDAVILAHSYQSRAVTEIADVVGDSFQLSQMATKYPQKNLILCGVHFMAETAKMLSPEKRVFLPNPQAGCPMAEQLEPEMLAYLKAQEPDRTVVAYINTTAKLKELCDVCVTSSSAVKIVKNQE